ncbi:hypothetical protein VTO73DRAFT_14347 [Trametes versicolor]
MANRRAPKRKPETSSSSEEEPKGKGKATKGGDKGKDKGNKGEEKAKASSRAKRMKTDVRGSKKSSEEPEGDSDEDDEEGEGQDEEGDDDEEEDEDEDEDEVVIVKKPSKSRAKTKKATKTKKAGRAEAQTGEGDEGDPIHISEHSESGDELTLRKKTRMKSEMARDLALFFSKTQTVRFRLDKGKGKTAKERGRWCTLCQDDKKVIEVKGARAGWYKGGNSTLRRHIAASHYELYAKRCKEEGLEEQEAAIPADVKEARERAASKGKGKESKTGQTTLDGVVKVQAPTAFSPEAIMDAVAKHIVCGDQALLLADSPTFTNCLIVMHPKTGKRELPTRTTVRTYIGNKFVDFIVELRTTITAAPGKISSLWDLWTAPHTSDGYFGLLIQWIEVLEPEDDDAPPIWRFRVEVPAFRKVYGDHGGLNLGRNFIRCLDRCGVTSRDHWKLGHVTNDNASNNTTAAEAMAARLRKRGIEATWDPRKQQLSCFAHVIQLGVEDFMKEVTQIAVVESKQAIWEYDPQLLENRIAAGGLDVIAIIRTLAVKIQASGQRKELFHRYQRESGIDTPLVIPLHSNVRWGSAALMCERAHKLRTAIDQFIITADLKFGPITTIRERGRIVKKIPWTVFQLSGEDWNRVHLCAEILAVSNSIRVRVLHARPVVRIRVRRVCIHVHIRRLLIRIRVRVRRVHIRVRHVRVRVRIRHVRIRVRICRVCVRVHVCHVRDCAYVHTRMRTTCSFAYLRTGTPHVHDANRFHQVCSSTRLPTLHQVIPTIESISSRWEKKSEDDTYGLFHSALQRGLEKLTKYYKKFDNTHVYVLSLLLHPYYKLAYIEQMWGGEEEYLADVAAGVHNARNWQAYATEIVEKAMQEYWPMRLMAKGAATPPPTQADNANAEGEDNYDRARAQRLLAAATKGWKVELDQYIADPSANVNKDSDTVKWWACLNFHWKPTIVDWARLNDQLTVDVYLQDFEYMYAEEAGIEDDSDVESN